LFKWFEDLRVEAEAVGGRVISHMGNHEWMNVIGAVSTQTFHAFHLL